MRFPCLATERLEDPEPIDIGTGVEIPIADLARFIARLTGFEGEIRFDPSKPDGQPRRCLDVTKARELLGFESSTPLTVGLNRTIEWNLTTSHRKVS
jgi:GDP-L-fucose synthase